MQSSIKGSIAAAMLVASCLPAAALEARKIVAISKAADNFVEMAKDSHKTGQPPRQSDPAAKPLIDLVFDTSEIEHGQPVPWDELTTLNGWNRAAIRVGLVYFLAGTGATDLESLKDDPRAADKANRNAAEFAPEFGRYSDAQLRLQAASIDSVQAHMKTAPRAEIEHRSFQTGLTNISKGVAQAMTGLLGAFVIDGMTDDWRLARLSVAAALAPKAARFMQPEDLRKVQYAAIEAADHMQNPAVKSGLENLAETLSP